ncbi:hypothetical protein OAO87_03995, partial [bacterium]|nr:hypothetical protein [bacterium]
MVLLLVQPVRALCGAPPASAAISLRLDRALRHLLQPARKTVRLTLVRDAPPLAALHQALRAEGLADADTRNLHITHGKRAISSNDELADVLRSTALRGVEPLLRVTPLDVDALSVPPPPTNEPGRSLATAEKSILLSFFKFVPLDAEARTVLLPAVHALLERLGVRGTVYLAAEGVNGQMCCPIEALPELQAAFARLPRLEGVTLNVQHASLGTVEASSSAPYRKLVVREKAQILTDGLAGGGLDWQRAGTELEPDEWHAMLLRRRAVAS